MQYKPIAMLKLINLILILCCMSILGKAANPYIVTLDSAIDARHQTMVTKEHKLSALKVKAHKAKDEQDRLRLLDKIFDEYLTYRYDSALAYINQCLTLSKKLSNKEYYNKSVINYALLDVRRGFFDKASAYLNSLDVDRLSKPLRFQYYNASYWLNMNLKDFVSESKEKAMYRKLMEKSARFAYASAEAGSANYYYMKGEILALFDLKLKAAIEAYKKVLKLVPLRSKLYASSAYAIAENYKNLHNINMYEQWITKAAISDMLAPLKENFALQELAMHLFEKDNNNVERATKYIYCSMDDAQFFNSQVNIINISKKFPVILSAYTNRINIQRRNLLYGLLALIVLAFFVIAALFYIRKQRNMLHDRWEELRLRDDGLRQQHDEVTRKNDLLEIQSDKLLALNNQLIDVNGKREILAKVFIELCASYIDKFKKYQILVQRKIRANQVKELLSTVSSSRLSEEDAATFIIRFDKAFLELYPTFVDDFNTLLLPENRITLKEPNTLTSELRIFALIHLGVTDSIEIADLLFLTPRTIYNYRSVMKNKAINKDTFDEDVKSSKYFQ